MIASHYTEPLERVVAVGAELRTGPSPDAAVVRQLEPGEVFGMVDESVGWAWGYAGTERRVGYVRSDALAEK